MFKIVNNLCYFPPEIVLRRPTVPYFPRPSLLQQPFCRTSAFAHSFVPDAIRKWNCLPIELTSSQTLHSFKSSFSVFTCQLSLPLHHTLYITHFISHPLYHTLYITPFIIIPIIIQYILCGYILALAALLLYVTLAPCINYYKKFLYIYIYIYIYIV